MIWAFEHNTETEHSRPLMEFLKNYKQAPKWDWQCPLLCLHTFFIQIFDSRKWSLMLWLFFLTRHLFLGNHIHFSQRKKKPLIKQESLFQTWSSICEPKSFVISPLAPDLTFQLAAFASFSPKFCAPSLSLTFQRSCCSWWQIVTLYQEDLRYNCTNIGETVSAIRACTITRLRPLPFEAWEAHPIHWKLMLS